MNYPAASGRGINRLIGFLAPRGGVSDPLRNEFGDDDIFIYSLETNENRQVTNHSATDTSPEWSSDGTSLAFLSDRGGTWQVVILNLETDRTTDYPLNTESFLALSPLVGGLTWSPTSNSIAFWAGNQGSTGIYKLDLDSLEVTVIVDDPSKNFMPAWSPDGENLVFVSNRDGYHNLFFTDKDGNGLQRLTNNTYSDLRPVWSENGEQIYFYSSKELGGTSWQIFVMNANGSEIQAITDGSLGIDGESW